MKNVILILSMLIATALTAKAQTWDGTTATGYEGGDGTAESPYLIANGQQLAKLAEDMLAITDFSKGKYFKLTADIVMNEGVFEAIVPSTRQDQEDLPKDNDLSMFRETPNIGSYDSDDSYVAFQGTFDGDGHRIIGLLSKLYSGKTFDGLFRVLENATVKNLGISDSYLLSNAYVGALAGRVIDSNIVNCYVERSYIEGGGSRNAALIGQCLGHSQMVNCYADATVFGKNDMGGLIGRIGNGRENSCVVDNCFAYVNIREKRRNNGAISSECGLGSTVRNCYYCKLGETQGAIWKDYLYGTVENTQELSAEAFAADGLLADLNSRSQQLAGAARWKSGERHPQLDYSQFTEDTQGISVLYNDVTPGTRTYLLNGMATGTANAHGVYIIRTTSSNGKSTVKKVIR